MFQVPFQANTANSRRKMLHGRSAVKTLENSTMGAVKLPASEMEKRMLSWVNWNRSA